jgi:uncharacterized protein YxjI
VAVISETSSSLLDADRFAIRQRLLLVANRYDVCLAGEDGRTEGERIAYVEQKRFTLKEDLRFYRDDTEQQELFRLKARQVFDPIARYAVTDADGNPIGGLGKAFGRSLTRSTWRLYTSEDTELGWATERSLFRSLLRRLIGLVGLVPIVGDLIALIPIRYHFDFFVGDRRVGSLERLFSFRDRYLLDLTGDEERAIDRRLAIAAAVAMDALQAR